MTEMLSVCERALYNKHTMDGHQYAHKGWNQTSKAQQKRHSLFKLNVYRSVSEY